MAKVKQRRTVENTIIEIEFDDNYSIETPERTVNIKTVEKDESGQEVLTQLTSFSQKGKHHGLDNAIIIVACQWAAHKIKEKAAASAANE